MSQCRSCHAEIVWARTVKGKRIPVDKAPVSDGNITLHPTMDGPPTAIVHSQPPLGDERLYVSHYVTCPDADSWRKR